MQIALKLGSGGPVGSLLTRLLKSAQAVACALGSPLLYVPDDYLRVGPNLVVNGDAATGDFTGWTHPDTAPSVTDVYQGTFRMTAAPGGTIARLRQGITLPNGQYLVSCTVSGYSGTPSAALAIGNTGAGDITYGNIGLAGNGQFQGVANVVGGFLGLAFVAGSSAGGVIQIDDVKVQAILSAADYQDSAGTLPAYLGSTVGLLTDRAYGGELGDDLVVNGDGATGDFTGWTHPDTAPSVTDVYQGTFRLTAAPGGTLARLRQSITLPSKSYAVTVVASGFTGTPSCTLALGNTSSGDTTYGNIGITGNGTFSAVAHVTGGFLGLAYTAGSTPGGVVQVKTYVRELKGNHATQATAGARPLLASSVRPDGKPNYLLAYDGSNDFEQLAVNPIGSNLSQPYTIVVSGVVGAVGGSSRYICGDSARGFGVNASGQVFMDHIVGATASWATPVTQGTAFVAEVTWDGATVNIWWNGVLVKTSALAAPTTAAGAFTLGQRGNNTAFWNGRLDGHFVKDAVIPDAQRKTIAKAFAAKGGITYVG